MECALALQRLGFILETLDDRRLSLRRSDGRRVFVPRNLVLEPSQLRAILHVADVREDEFAAVLPSGTSGTYARPNPDELMPPEASRKQT